MPRPTPDTTKPLPYIPGPPPVFGSSQEEMTRAVWDEFNRISAVLAQMPVTPAKSSEASPP